MAFAASTARAAIAPEQATRLHFILRFSVAATASFVISEAFGWYPTFLPAVLAGALLANLPTHLSPKMGIGLTLLMAVISNMAFLLSTLFQYVPHILVGLIGLILFLGFAALAHGKGKLPVLLLLICIATIPMFTLIAPQQAGALPTAFTRGMAIAVAAILLVQAVWPQPPKVAPAPASIEFASPIARAAVGTAIILPLILFYMMFGLTDAVPVLMTTVLLVSNFDPRRGAMQGMAMMIGNFLGGMIAILAYMILNVAPSLTMLAMIIFLICLLFAVRLEAGGPTAPVALITFNSTLIIFGLAMMQGSSNSGLWLTRLFQFGLATTFAIVVMILVWGRPRAEP